MNKKAALQLSVNFIVILVLTMIVLAFGFYIVTEIFLTATEAQERLSEQTEDEIRQALTRSGEMITLPINAYKIRRGDKEVIGVGVRNLMGADDTFYFEAPCTEAIATDGTELCGGQFGPCTADQAGNCADWIITSDDWADLANRDDIVVGLFAQVPKDAPAGTYGFSFKACTYNFCSTAGTQYGPTKKFYVTVPE